MTAEELQQDLNGILERMIGECQSPRRDDMIRLQCQRLLIDHMAQYSWADIEVVCDHTNNTPETIAQGVLVYSFRDSRYKFPITAEEVAKRIGLPADPIRAILEECPPRS